MQAYTQQWLTAYAVSNGNNLPVPYITSTYVEEGIWTGLKVRYPELKSVWCIPTTSIDDVIFVKSLNHPDMVAVYEYHHNPVDGSVTAGPAKLRMSELGEIIHDAMGGGVYKIKGP